MLKRIVLSALVAFSAALLPAQAQSVDDIFDDSGLLKATAAPIIMNMANDYLGQHPLPLSYEKWNNVVTLQVFESEFVSAVDGDIPESWKTRLHSAVYSKYTQVSFQNWDAALNNQLAYAAAQAGIRNPASCTNYRAGTVWEVFANAYNNAVYQGKNPTECAAAGWAAVKAAFPCYGPGGGGLLSVGDIQTWEQIWAWFIRMSLLR